MKRFLKRSIKFCLRKLKYEIQLLFILLLVLQFAATMPSDAFLKRFWLQVNCYCQSGSAGKSWLWVVGTEVGRVNNNKISNYLAQTNYRLDVRLGFPDYVTVYAPHNLQGRLEHFSRLFHLLCLYYR